MSKAEKTFEKEISGKSDANISFEDVCKTISPRKFGAPSTPI